MPLLINSVLLYTAFFNLFLNKYHFFASKFAYYENLMYICIIKETQTHYF